MDDLIIEDMLKAGKFEYGCKLAVERLNKSESTSFHENNQKPQTWFTARVMAILNKQGQKILADNVQIVVNCALSCYEDLQLHPVEWKHPLDLEKYMYTITVNVAKKGFCSEALSLGKVLLETFKMKYHKEPESAKTMSYNLYYNLWDCSNSLALNNDNQYDLVFRLRRIAVYFLLLNNSDMYSCHEKVLSAVEKFEKTNKKGELKDEGKEMRLWGQDICLAYINPYCHKELVSYDEGQVIQRICLSMELCIKLLKLLNKWLYTTEAAVLEKAVFEGLTKLVREASQLGDKTKSLPAFICECNLSKKYKIPNYISHGADNMMSSLERLSNDTVVIYLSRMLSNFLGWGLCSVKTQKTQFSTSVGISMTAYNHLSPEERVSIEKMHVRVQELSLCEIQHHTREWRNSDVQSNERTRVVKRVKALVLNQVISLSDCIYVMVSRLHEIDKSKQEKAEAIVNKCESFTKFVCEILADELPLQPGVTLPYEEYMHAGFLCFKIGRVISTKVGASKALVFYEMGLQQYEIWNSKASKAEKQKYPLGSKYDTLAQVQRKSHDFSAAMNSVCMALLCDNPCTAGSMDLWCNIKYDISKSLAEKDHQKLIKRSIWQTIQSVCISNGLKCTIDAREIYAEEFLAYKSKGNILVTSRYALLLQYIPIVKCPALKARLLLDKAEIAWTTRSEKYGDAYSVVKEALDLLLKSSSEKDTIPSYWDDLAATYLLLYIVNDVDTTEMQLVGNKKKKKDPDLSRPDSPLDDLDEAELYQSSTTLKEESSMVEPALRALQSWQSADVSKESSFRNLGESLNAMMLLVEVFKLLNLTKEQSQMSGIIIQLCQKQQQEQQQQQQHKKSAEPSTGSPPYQRLLVQATVSQCQLLMYNTQPQLAMKLIEGIKEMVNALQVSGDKDKDMRTLALCCLFHGVHSETHLMLNEVEAGWSKLQQALNLKESSIRPRTKEDLQLEGYLRRLHARFLSLPDSYWPNGPPESSDWALEVLIRGARSIGGVICSLLGPSFINTPESSSVSSAVDLENVLEKWTLLDQLLEMFQEVGTVFLQIGDARDAKCYLQQGVLISQTMKKPKRLAHFHLLMSRLDNVSGKFQDSRAHLHTVAYILNSNTENSVKVSAVRNQAKNEDVISDRKSTEKDGFQIKSVGLEFEEHLEFTSERPSEQAASPKHHKEQFEVPVFWTHDEDCDCELCSDVETIRIGLLYVLCYSELYIMEGKHQLGKKYLNLLFSKVDSFGRRSLKVLSGFINNCSRFESSDVKACTYQSVIIEGCKLMVYMALVDLDLKSHQEWSHKMKSLLQLECYPWMVTAWVDIAESHHLGVTPSLPWPPCEDDRHKYQLFDDLWTQVEKLSLNTEEVRNCATPVMLAPSKTRSRVQKAPVKKRKGILSSVVTPTAVTAEADSNKDSPLGDLILGKDFNPATVMNLAKVCEDEDDEDLEFKVLKPKKTGRKVTNSAVTKKANTIEKASNSSSVTSVNMLSAKATAKKQRTSPVIGCTNIKSTPLCRIKTARATTTTNKSSRAAVAVLQQNLKENLPNMALFRDSPDHKFTVFTENSGKKSLDVKSKLKDAFDFQCSSPELTPLVQKKTSRRVGEKKTTSVVKAAQSNKGNSVRKSSSKSNIESSRTCEIGVDRNLDLVCSLGMSKLALEDIKDDLVFNAENIKSNEESEWLNQKKTHRVTNSSHNKQSKQPSSESRNTLKPKRTYDVARVVSPIMSNAPLKAKRTYAKQVKNTNNATPLKAKKTHVISASPNHTATLDRDRVTRSKTVIEDQRYDSDCESDEIGPELEVSGIVCELVDDHIGNYNMSLVSVGESPMVERRSMLDSSAESPAALPFKGNETYTMASPAVLSPLPTTAATWFKASDPETEVENVRAGDADGYHGGENGLAHVLEGLMQVEKDELQSGIDRAPEPLEEEIELLRGGHSGDSDSENFPPSSARGSISDLKSKRTHKAKKEEKGLKGEAGVEMPRKTVLKMKTKTSSSSVPHKEVLSAKAGKHTTMSPHNAMSTTAEGEIKQHLLHAFSLLRSHPPSVPYRSVCHALATLELNCGNKQEAVFYISEAQSVVFRHNALMNISKKIRKLSTVTQGLAHLNLNEETVKSRLYAMGEVLAFNKNVSDLKTAIKDLPAGWTVCELSVIKSPSQDSGELLITHMTRAQPLLLHRLPGYSTNNGQKILGEFAELMQENKTSMHITERREWWGKRNMLNLKFGEILDDIVGIWLAGWKCLLLGLPSDDGEMKKLQRVTDSFCSDFSKEEDFNEETRVRIKAVLNGCHLLQERELLEVMCEISSDHSPAHLHQMCRDLRRASDGLAQTQAQRHPTVLILDRDVQHFPWESLSFLRVQPVSRVPNLYFLQTLLQQQVNDPNSLYNTGMDPHQAYYILNPESNLPSTQEMFQDWFQREKGWNGITGKIPTMEEYKQALTKDMFLYCGHGGGNRFLSGDIIQTMQARACAVLMGCSSGKLTVMGQLEASGLMLSYFLAGCPCILANLWDVTDRDIDRFTEELLKSWLAAKPGSCITEPFEKSRKTCRLLNLIGAAPVLYGIPVRIADKGTKS